MAIEKEALYETLVVYTTEEEKEYLRVLSRENGSTMRAFVRKLIRDAYAKWLGQGAIMKLLPEKEEGLKVELTREEILRLLKHEGNLHRQIISNPLTDKRQRKRAKVVRVTIEYLLEEIEAAEKRKARDKELEGDSYGSN